MTPCISFLPRISAILVGALLLCAAPSRADESLPGLGSSTSTPSRNAVPSPVETALTDLLRAVPNGKPVPDRAVLAPLLEFARSDMRPDKAQLQKREQGAGAVVRTTLRAPLSKVARYFFDPAIPGEALFPSALRRHYWLPGSEILTRKVQLWNHLTELTNATPPLVVRGAEYEEITPDTFSGSYYSYTLDRLILLLKFQDRATIISVTTQRGPSGVGHKGAILGKDPDWHYLYSKIQGSNLKLAGWADTYLYDSANITLFYETTPGAQTTDMVIFKYLRAGWANMNMVKSSHIASGTQRFLNGLRQVLESPGLPTPEAIAERVRQISTMDENALRTALMPYNAALNQWNAQGAALPSSDFKKLLDGETYLGLLNRQEMGSELLKQYMKQHLGKATLPSPGKGR